MHARIPFVLALAVSLMAVSPMAASPAAADPLPSPEGPVVLTITGETDAANSPEGVKLDLATLRRFPEREIRTTTYWHEGEQHFRGVSALALLEALGVREGVIEARASDDYTVRIPLEALKAYEPVFALELNGDGLEDEAEGPVWLVFPYDEMTPEERERYTAWSIWALEQIKIER